MSLLAVSRAQSSAARLDSQDRHCHSLPREKASMRERHGERQQTAQLSGRQGAHSSHRVQESRWHSAWTLRQEWQEALRSRR